jgi:hypothetical protein
LIILRERSVKIYSSYIRIILISESATSKRVISCEMATLSIFACKIVRGFVDKGLVLIFKRGESV